MADILIGSGGSLSVPRTGGDEAVERDQEEQELARQFRFRSMASRRSGGGKSGLHAAQQRIQQTETLVKQARNIKTILTLAGGLTSLTILGVIWTVFQWNVQMFWTLFGFPGQEFIGLPVWMVPVVIILDIIVFIAIVILTGMGYAYSHPVETLFTFPKFFWDML